MSNLQSTLIGKSNALLVRAVASSTIEMAPGASSSAVVNLSYNGYTVLGVIGVSTMYAMCITNIGLESNISYIGLYNYSSQNRSQIVYVRALYVRN